MNNTLIAYKDLGFKCQMADRDNRGRDFKDIKMMFKGMLNAELNHDDYMTGHNAFNEGRDQFINQNGA